MSVNITVSGKFSKKSIFDPEGYKKQLENERRMLRLHQVREQSKEFARKIRTEVAQEKARQLRNMEAVKAQEMNLWRRSLVTKKRAEFQRALNQVGSAQLAARKETEQLKEKERLSKTKRPTTRLTREPISQRKKVEEQPECEKPKNDESKRPKTSVGEKSSKSKQMNVCFDENLQPCVCVSSIDSCSTDELLETCDLCASTSSSFTSLDLESQTNSKTTQTESGNGVPLKRAPTVLLDVDALRPVSKHITRPTHVSDKHVETNRQFDSVICVVPEKETVATQTVETMAQIVENTAISTDRPRYTQISDLIAKQKSSEQDKGSGDMADTIIEDVLEKLPPNEVDKPSSVPVLSDLANQNVPLRATSSLPTTKVTPKKRTHPYPINRVASHISRSSTITATTTTTTTASSKESADNTDGASNSVKFYDYNNKFAKEYTQPPNVVSVLECNKDELNAMERAELEKQRKMEREKELENLMKKSEERGKLALEREKVRRDCVELTAKLDALMEKGTPLLPTDANLHSKPYYSGQTARKEAKMNSAIEELLSRPAIITLSETRNEIAAISHKERDRSPKKFSSKALNLDSRLCSGDSDNAASKSSDTDGSGSILLGYIDDQRDQIRSQLSQCEGTEVKNLEKRNKLVQLLQRIEALRTSLLAELKKNTESEMRVKGEKQTSWKTPSQPLDERERELKEREIRLQNELAEVIQIQKNFRPEKVKPKANTVESNAIKITAGEKQIIQKSSSDAPLEIVIKVKGDIKRSKKKEKASKLTAEDGHKKELKTPATVIPSGNKEAKTLPNVNSRCSYDSNSTHYQSIPSALPMETEQFVKRMKQLRNNEKQQSSSSSSSVRSGDSSESAENQKCTRAPHLNPLIAQYIQRLLGMSRQSVKALQVSSSDIETPSSSVINIITNKSSSSRQGSLLTGDQLKRVELFVNENRSFINELEESIRTHSNASLETSLRQFEEIWRQKFKDGRAKDATEKPKASRGSILKTSKPEVKVKDIPRKPSKQVTQSQSVEPLTKTTEMSQQKKSQQKESKKSMTRTVEKSPGHAAAENYATQAQLNHYAELTKNCSNRIAELTALINKVREEKQRIMENTLTSVSDNGRNSAEYADLPPKAHGYATEIGQKSIQKENSAEQDQIQDAAPLEKHKQTGRSRDSGISMPSRPVTALDYETSQEPPSYSTTATNTQSSSTQRKPRVPPPTIQRYNSPQLPEDEVVHELSTIVEVDTPVTSRINASMQATQTENTSQATRKTVAAFPTFEQYCKDFNLDMTMLDPEQSTRMEHEYNDLIEAMKEGHGDKAYYYEEFPTLTTYLTNLTGSEQVCQTAETLDDLFGCLRLAPLIVKPFPSHKEYINRLPGSPEGRKLLDSASLENLTETHSARSDGESETLDIESELKRRNILRESFRSKSTRYNAVSTSSTCGRNEKTASQPSSKTTTVETGIQKMTITTSSDSASEKFQRELLALGLKWHTPMRSKEKEAAALRSSTSSSVPLNATNGNCTKSPKKHKPKKTDSDCLSDSESSDRPLNLRDFLTRQLMKHVAVTSNCSSSSLSGDSLRSQFFMAVLDSMSPSGSPRTNTNTNTASHSRPQHGLERQKTSTPVQTSAVRSNTNPRSSVDASKSAEATQSQLFSNESGLSFVQSSSTKKQTIPKSKPQRRHEKEDEAK